MKKNLGDRPNMVRGSMALIFAMSFLFSSAHAQESEPEVSYKRKTVINFEDDTIEGSLQTPDGQYLEARKKMRHRSLIRIRRHFREKVLGSVNGL